MVRPREDLAGRLWSKVWKYREQGACWVWFGHKLRGGYGSIGRGGRDGGHVPVHRLVWELLRGPIPEGKLVLHHCDVPNCVNPDHLFLGTQKDNMQDKVKKGRDAWGAKNGNSVLTEEQVKEIRSKYSRGSRQIDLVREYGVGKYTIYAIVRNVTWRKLL